MANILTLMGSEARMEPETKTIANIVIRPFKFLVFMIIISVTTNMMPFYKDGTRMNLLDGVTTLLNKKGAITTPYEIPETGPSRTSVINKREPLNRNYITFLAYEIADLFRVDAYTGILLFLCLLSMLYNMVVAFNELQFDKIERVLHKKAFDPSVHTKELDGMYKKIVKPAYIIVFAVSAVVSMGFPTVFFNFGKDKFEIILTPVLLVFVLLFMIKVYFYAQKSYGFHKRLVVRRCYNCSHIDCFRVTGRDFVRTDVTTTDHYYLNRDGSRGKTFKSETSEHNVYKYHILCENCGDTSTMTI